MLFLIVARRRSKSSRAAGILTGIFSKRYEKFSGNFPEGLEGSFALEFPARWAVVVVRSLSVSGDVFRPEVPK